MLNVVTDRKLQIEDDVIPGDVAYYIADVVAQNDFYPFGMLMPNTNVDPVTGDVIEADNDYRYSFQGQEKDDEIKGNDNSINYKYRMHDPRIGRFFAVDPLAPDYPHNSPYAFSENKVIHMVELEGLEAAFIQLELRVASPIISLAGITMSSAVGIAADTEGNLGAYYQFTIGPQVGAGVSGGVAGGINFTAENISSLEGYGENIGGFVTPSGAGYTFAGEVNLAVETDMDNDNPWYDKPTEGNVSSGGVSASIPGASAGLGLSLYAEGSYTKFFVQGNVGEVLDEVIKQFEGNLSIAGESFESLGITAESIENAVMDFYQNNNVATSIATSTGSVEERDSKSNNSDSLSKEMNPVKDGAKVETSTPKKKG